MDQILSFEWDQANIDKNWLKHKVSPKECEELFSNKPLILFKDIKHSQVEPRFGALGRTNGNRMLHIIFTVRRKNIRVISARVMNKKERTIYANEKIS